jgi:predicted ribosomally synthesized peptide with SipW-like signal peptide
MKKRLLAAAALSLCLCQGTWAYFSVQKTSHKTIQSGTVQAALRINGTKSEQSVSTHILPGAALQNTIQAENESESSVWIRIKINTASLPAQLDINEDDWLEKDGWHYLKRPLQGREISPALCTQLSFPKELGNEFQNQTLTLSIVLQAVQHANNGTSPLQAAGWPEEDI